MGTREQFLDEFMPDPVYTPCQDLLQDGLVKIENLFFDTDQRLTGSVLSPVKEGRHLELIDLQANEECHALVEQLRKIANDIEASADRLHFDFADSL